LKLKESYQLNHYTLIMQQWPVDWLKITIQYFPSP
jgi:hypothetical protein